MSAWIDRQASQVRSQASRPANRSVSLSAQEEASKYPHTSYITSHLVGALFLGFLGGLFGLLLGSLSRLWIIAADVNINVIFIR